MVKRALFTASYEFGVLVSRQKIVLISLVFLLLPVFGLFLSMLASAAGERIFAWICHQNPERSLTLAGATLPLCARCFGLYAGFGLAGVMLPESPSRRFSLRLLTVVLSFSVLFWFLRFFVPVLDDNFIRLVLGFGLGAGLALFLKSLLKE